ncbi:MAG: heavy-metal-associated domain-containing protein [Clostridia bacterium]|nr:heavy-metal-associated domain-containing protein [Clostridia bacterium]MCI9275685.1 heavy-metal-associated domain-containing protein [Clostridia bacterium]
MKSRFKIKGLDCANCAAELERAIEKIDGIDNVSISFMAERMELEFEDVKKEEIMKKLNKVIKREEPDVKIEEV